MGQGTYGGQIAELEDRLWQPIVAMVAALPLGSTGAGTSGLSGIVRGRLARRRAPGLPRLMFLAATSVDLIVLERTVLENVGDEVARWPLATLEVQSHRPGRVTLGLDVRSGDHPVIQLEVLHNKKSQPVVEAFLVAVGAVVV